MNIFSWFTRKKDPAAAMRAEMFQTRTIVEVRKKPHYHEIACGKVRIYSRATGLVHEADAGPDPVGEALALLKRFNGEG